MDLERTYAGWNRRPRKVMVESEGGEVGVERGDCCKGTRTEEEVFV